MPIEGPLSIAVTEADDQDGRERRVDFTRGNLSLTESLR
jgi:hypothetical protein